MLKYPIGVQTFEEIRTGGYVYVDKTEHVYRLADGGKYYFLSRPRRFGKSLLLSTMEAYFKGRKELFEGLEIEGLEKEWAEYPVLRLDLGGASYHTREDLDNKLSQILAEWEAQYGVTSVYQTSATRFNEVISCVARHEGRKVVVLVDEYDKPITDSLGDEELLEYYRATLQGFFSVLKSQDDKIRFAFLIGVTKIGKLSVFSGLNNLKDISMLPAYSGICGITERELTERLAEGISNMAASNGITPEECLGRLREMYDGYHFSASSEGVYNPFSLLNALQDKEFNDYWFETGTPSFLVSLIKNTSYDISALQGEEVDSSLLVSVNSAFANPIPLLYQSGYLTITGYDREVGLYRLDFPNKEVKNGFLSFVLQYSTSSTVSGKTLIARIHRALRDGRPEDMMKELDAFFSRKNYQIQADEEKDFQYAVSTIFELLSEDVQTEKQTSNGRIDLLMQTSKYIYVMEIKVNDSADSALRQIEEKGYARPFANDGRKVFRIGVNFSTRTRRIEDWKIEQGIKTKAI